MPCLTSVIRASPSVVAVATGYWLASVMDEIRISMQSKRIYRPADGGLGYEYEKLGITRSCEPVTVSELRLGPHGHGVVVGPWSGGGWEKDGTH